MDSPKAEPLTRPLTLMDAYHDLREAREQIATLRADLEQERSDRLAIAKERNKLFGREYRLELLLEKGVKAAEAVAGDGSMWNWGQLTQFREEARAALATSEEPRGGGGS